MNVGSVGLLVWHLVSGRSQNALTLARCLCMASQSGTLTATLEALVRQGVITSFEMPPGSNAILLHVIVAAPVVTNPHNPSYDRETVERVRRRVAREVKPFRGDRDVLVSVRGLR